MEDSATWTFSFVHQYWGESHCLDPKSDNPPRFDWGENSTQAYLFSLILIGKTKAGGTSFCCQVPKKGKERGVAGEKAAPDAQQIIIRWAWRTMQTSTLESTS